MAGIEFPCDFIQSSNDSAIPMRFPTIMQPPVCAQLLTCYLRARCTCIECIGTGTSAARRWRAGAKERSISADARIGYVEGWHGG
jgi:hypothetical protein